MKLFHPVTAVRQQKTPRHVLAEVKRRRAPLIGALIEEIRTGVVAGNALLRIGAGVRVRDVQNDRKPQMMRLIHQTAEPVRRAVARRRRKITAYLIPEGLVQRMLGNPHELHRRVAVGLDARQHVADKVVVTAHRARRVLARILRHADVRFVNARKLRTHRPVVAEQIRRPADPIPARTTCRDCPSAAPPSRRTPEPCALPRSRPCPPRATHSSRREKARPSADTCAISRRQRSPARIPDAAQNSCGSSPAIPASPAACTPLHASSPAPRDPNRDAIPAADVNPHTASAIHAPVEDGPSLPENAASSPSKKERYPESSLSVKGFKGDIPYPQKLHYTVPLPSTITDSPLKRKGEGKEGEREERCGGKGTPF